jgi:predicted DNA-binding protein (MmcQ/YjbR family)
MNLKMLHSYLLTKKGTTEETPFGPAVLVFKVMGKMFALVARQESPLRITLKGDPDLALTLRHQYQAVQPGYHMSKKHWNTITLNGTVPEEVILAMIDDSYRLVVKSLKKSDRRRLEDEKGLQ